MLAKRVSEHFQLFRPPFWRGIWCSRQDDVVLGVINTSILESYLVQPPRWGFWGVGVGRCSQNVFRSITAVHNLHSGDVFGAAARMRF
jgi:hypothetical protein